MRTGHRQGQARLAAHQSHIASPREPWHAVGDQRRPRPRGLVEGSLSHLCDEKVLTQFGCVAARPLLKPLHRRVRTRERWREAIQLVRMSVVCPWLCAPVWTAPLHGVNSRKWKGPARLDEQTKARSNQRSGNIYIYYRKTVTPPLQPQHEQEHEPQVPWPLRMRCRGHIEYDRSQR